MQIVSKSGGQVKIIETVGVSRVPNEIKSLEKKAKAIIPQIQKQTSLLPLADEEKKIEDFIGKIANAQIHTIGPELIFGRIFDKLGFGTVKDELFRHLVIARLSFPGSKLKTIDYLQRYKGITLSVDRIYRFLDKLRNHYKEEVEQIAFEHTKKLSGGKINVIFYDMTTLFFQAESEDDLRRIGFSKDGKFRKPQIMLGLLVGLKGYPIGYNIFEGNTYEGHTLIPILEHFQKRFGLGKPVIIADSALLNKDNLKSLADQNYEYIIGARIKNETEKIKEQILNLKLTDGKAEEIQKNADIRLIVSYSKRGAKKDLHNRQKGLKRLEESLRSGKLTKEHINNRGYNKYLSLKGEINIKIDYEKFEQDRRWEGLKGYVTNSNLRPKEIIANYACLWQIEKAFRISKTDLKIRPIFHRLRKRIESHICIAFVAYTVYKELERLLYKHNAPFSVQRAGELTQNMYELEYVLPKSLKSRKTIFRMDQEQLLLKKIVDKYAR